MTAGLEFAGNQRLQAIPKYKETPDVVQGVVRMVRSVGKRVAMDDPESLALLQALQAELDTAWSTAVAGLRAAGYSDGQIGAQLGITRQAVEQRWPRGGE